MKILKSATKAFFLIIGNLLNPNKICICRFQPSCTHYATLAIDQHGPLAGTLLIFRRLIKCHPWGPVGFDPVPPSKQPQI